MEGKECRFGCGRNGNCANSGNHLSNNKIILAVSLVFSNWAESYPFQIDHVEAWRLILDLACFGFLPLHYIDPVVSNSRAVFTWGSGPENAHEKKYHLSFFGRRSSHVCDSCSFLTMVWLSLLSFLFHAKFPNVPKMQTLQLEQTIPSCTTFM